MNAKMVAIARTPRMKRPSWKAKAGTSRKAGTPNKLAIKTSKRKSSLKCSQVPNCTAMPLKGRSASFGVSVCD